MIKGKGYNLIHRPAPVFSSILYKCAHFRDAVHISQQLCTFPSSCARFTSPLITFWGDQSRSTDIYIYIHT